MTVVILKAAIRPIQKRTHQVAGIRIKYCELLFVCG